MVLLFLYLIGCAFAKEVCYAPYGCFNDAAPFTNTGMLKDLPESPDVIAPLFRLNNRDNRDVNNPDYLNPVDENTVISSQFIPNVKVVVIVHGYKDKFTADAWMAQITEELINADNVNVICVDWDRGAVGYYDQATANTRLVGRMIAELLKKIKSVHGVSYGEMHVIGHSLGSHIAGYVGQTLNGLLGKISGLDPAGLNFENKDAQVRLDSTDAQFVQVIHTDADAVIQLGWGMGKAIGDVDFYPNGGDNQPGCSKTVLSFFQNLLKGYIKEQVTCSHLRAFQLFKASINSCTFNGKLCSSYGDFQSGEYAASSSCTMGYWVDESCTKGNYYLTTTDTEPFC